MRFSDIIGSLDISTYPRVALILFIGVFIAAVGRVIANRASDELTHAARLPLEDAPLAPARSFITTSKETMP
jgi:cell division protein FtsL